MGSQRDDQVESLIGLDEAAEILEISANEVQDLIHDQKLQAFQLGAGLIRLKKDQVWEYQSKTRISAELFPDERARHHHTTPVQNRATAWERIHDFFYFNDFYILSFVLIAALLYLILTSP